jgi:predicted nucleic acid-binding protein
MRVVVADTGPLNYLTLIDAIDLLPRLFERIFVPAAVYDELTDDGTPAIVRAWIAQVPPWLEVKPNPDSSGDNAVATVLDDGERAAVALAGIIGAARADRSRAGIHAAQGNKLPLSTGPTRRSACATAGG